jgi:hypothetical protein
MARIRSLEYREYRRARERVLTRLAQAYPDQYKQYLEEEQGDEQKSESGSVTDTNDSTTGLGSRTTTTTLKKGKANYNNSAYKGNAGGEE